MTTRWPKLVIAPNRIHGKLRPMQADSSSKNWRIGKALCIFAAVTYGVAPAFIDTFDPHHLLNPEWPPHARLHLMWLNGAGLYTSLFSIYLFWTATRETFERIRMGATIGFLFLAGFFTAGLFKNPAGAAFDADGRLLFNLLPPAVAHMLTSTLILLAGYASCRKGSVK
jgi:hypothetical protein